MRQKNSDFNSENPVSGMKDKIYYLGFASIIFLMKVKAFPGYIVLIK